MAHTVQVTTLLNGPRHTVLHVYIKSDGASPDLDSYEIANPADFEQWPADNDRFYTIETIQSGLNGFSASLKFEYLVDGTLIWALPEAHSEFDFINIGGLRDRSPELDGTGKVLISTQGLDNNDEGSFVIKLRK